MNGPLRIGVIGAGSIMRQRHMPGLRQAGGVEITVVSNSTPESAERFIAENGLGARVEADWAAVCAAEDVDIVWIAAPPFLHAPAACAALGYGKHVFCQARMCMNTAETRGMVSVAQSQSELVAALCPAPYGMKHGMYVRQMLQDNALGRLLNLRFHSMSGIYADPEAPMHWRQRREVNGVNFLTVGIFGEVILHWLGPMKRLRAFGRVFYEERGGEEVELPDYASAHMEWDDGLVGTMEWSGVCPGPERHRLELYGTGGALIYDFNTDNIWLSQGSTGDFQPVQVPPEYVRPWRVEADFLDAVRGAGPRPRPYFLEGARYMVFAEGVLDSVESGEWIDLIWPEDVMMVG